MSVRYSSMNGVFKLHLYIWGCKPPGLVAVGDIYWFPRQELTWTSLVHLQVCLPSNTNASVTGRSTSRNSTHLQGCLPSYKSRSTSCSAAQGNYWELPCFKVRCTILASLAVSVTASHTLIVALFLSIQFSNAHDLAIMLYPLQKWL